MKDDIPDNSTNNSVTASNPSVKYWTTWDKILFTPSIQIDFSLVEWIIHAGFWAAPSFSWQAPAICALWWVGGRISTSTQWIYSGVSYFGRAKRAAHEISPDQMSNWSLRYRSVSSSASTHAFLRKRAGGKADTFFTSIFVSLIISSLPVAKKACLFEVDSQLFYY